MGPADHQRARKLGTVGSLLGKSSQDFWAGESAQKGTLNLREPWRSAARLPQAHRGFLRITGDWVNGGQDTSLSPWPTSADSRPWGWGWVPL